MSTFAAAKLDSSDDEADADFVPDVPKASSSKRKAKPARAGKSAKVSKPIRDISTRHSNAVEEDDGGESSAESSSTDSEDDEEGEGQQGADGADAKRRKLEEEEERRRKAKEAFASFMDAGDTPAGVSSDAKERNGDEKLVEIRRPRQFAGETIYETVRLPANHPEVIAFFAAQQSDKPDPTTAPSAIRQQADSSATAGPADPPAPASAQGSDTAAIAEATIASTAARPSTVEVGGTGSGSTNTSSAAPTPLTAPTLASAPASEPSSSSLPPKRPPPKRKPRQSLEAMSAALDKGKKMTTLEKSQMDWQTHTSSTKGLSDELASNRKAGGFLEKRDFLERVEDRRTGAFEQNKKTGRR